MLLFWSLEVNNICLLRILGSTFDTSLYIQCIIVTRCASFHLYLATGLVQAMYLHRCSNLPDLVTSMFPFPHTLLTQRLGCDTSHTV